MNKKKFMQTDSRWGGLGYPKSPWYIRNCGCGEVSIANCIIEMEQYKSYTPKTIQPYCKQYAAPNGDGTYWSGIPAMMKHYGMTEVKEHATMKPLWKELAKGGRVAIYLMGSKRGGSKGVRWTSSGHFICSVGYKLKGGKHYIYVKDSYSNSSLRNGWISYEDNLKYDVLKVWSGKINSKKPAPKKTVDQIAQEVIDGKWGNGDDRVARLKAAGYDPEAVQKKVNELLKPKTKTIVDKELDACKDQASWMKNAKYGWRKNPTIANTKIEGTCVSFVSVVLQRIGILESGQALWHNGKGYGTGKVTGANDKMQVDYMNNKSITSLKSKLKAGDIVMLDDNKSGEKGSGGHEMILTGKWNGDDPYVWDMEPTRTCIKTLKPRTYSGKRKVLARVRIK